MAEVGEAFDNVVTETLGIREVGSGIGAEESG